MQSPYLQPKNTRRSYSDAAMHYNQDVQNEKDRLEPYPLYENPYIARIQDEKDRLELLKKLPQKEDPKPLTLEERVRILEERMGQLSR